MHPSLRELFKRLHATGYRDLAGTTLVADIPLDDDFVNRVIEEMIDASDGPLRELHIKSKDGNRIRVHVRLAKWSFLPLKVQLDVEEQPDLPSSPVIVFRWQMLSAGLTALASRAVSFASALPPGIVIGGDRLAINIFTLMHQRGLDWLIPHVDRAQLTTVRGRVVLHLALRVPDAAARVPPR